MRQANEDLAPATIEEVLEFMSVVALLPLERREVVRRILSTAGGRNPAEIAPPMRYAPFRN